VGKRVRIIRAHWVKRFRHDSVVTRKHVNALPLDRPVLVSRGGDVISGSILKDGSIVCWDSAAKKACFRPRNSLEMEIMFESDWTWERFIAFLVTIGAVPVDADVRSMLSVWAKGA
jgi:hypothetical protein